MPGGITKHCRRGRLHVYPKPRTQDAFVNSTLTSLGRGRDGVERFWISTCNRLCGATSFLLTEDGDCRTYPWPDNINCVYSVAQESSSVLWLGALGAGPFFVRLDLRTGKWQRYPLPAGRFLTAGMVYDPRTRKVFSGAQTAMVTFDTRTRRFGRIYEKDEIYPDCFHFDHWRNPDGTYGFLVVTPGLSYVRWFPREDQIEWRRLLDDGNHPLLEKKQCYRTRYVSNGRLYVPHLGWLDGLTGKIAPHRRPPEREATWFGVRGSRVFGGEVDASTGDLAFRRWNTRTGKVEDLFVLPDVPPQNCALSRRGKVLSVDITGVFRRHDGSTGALELTRKIGVSQYHRCNTITPAGKHAIVGTPFICQNFWILDTRTGKGHEAGRAAGSYGQVDYSIRVGGKVYFSVYGGSQLMEYDPALPANYPRNPRLVAKSDQGQHGAGITTDGRVVWAAFRPKYGTLDGAMIRYDTGTGEATYRNGAIKHEHVYAPRHDPVTGNLVAGSSFLSDCDTADPTRSRCYAVVLDPDTMAVKAKVAAPKDTSRLELIGPLGRRRWLVRSAGVVGVFDERRMTLSTADEFIPLPETHAELHYAGAEGRFVLCLLREMRLWSFATGRTDTLARYPAGRVLRSWVHGRSIYCDCRRRVAVLHDVLPRLNHPK